VTLEVDVQYAAEVSHLPTIKQLQTWAAAAYRLEQDAEVVIRIVDEAESAELNQRYRHKRGATNVLSFAFEAPSEIESHALGDLVLCAPVIVREAREQHKPALAHWAHMVVHGMLHLQGHDHQTDAQAQAMEALEVEILSALRISNPYL
jgi:probable rRNA maturation factor